MMTLRDLLILNLTLQVFDGLFSYQAFSLLGAHEANPFVGAAISSWGVIYGLLYKKVLACALLFLIFVLGRRHAGMDVTRRGFGHLHSKLLFGFGVAHHLEHVVKR
jgi:hypothetical protein